MIWLIVIFLSFAFVIAFGAPYLATHTKAVEKAFELLDLQPGQLLIDLGSGDGKIQLYAAKQGIKSIGYELNPILVLISKLRLWRYRSLAEVRWGNYWKQRLPQADAVFVFLLPRFMNQFDGFVKRNHRKPLKVVSYSSPIPNKQPVKEAFGLFLYQY